MYAYHIVQCTYVYVSMILKCISHPTSCHRARHLWNCTIPMVACDAPRLARDQLFRPRSWSPSLALRNAPASVCEAGTENSQGCLASLAMWTQENPRISFQLTSYGTISMPHCLYGVTFERTCTPVSFNVSQILTSYQPSLQQCKLNKSYILQTWVNSKEAIHKSDQHVLKANQWDQCAWSQ